MFLKAYSNMNIPIHPEPHISIETGIGNASTGGAPNRPFQVAQKQVYLPRYAEESYNFPRFNAFWKQPNQSTYNPIRPTQVNSHHIGNSGNGDNQNPVGAGKTPMAWSPYDLGSLGSRGGPSQTFPYDRNSMTVEGNTRQVWKLGFNVNEGESIDIASGQEEVVSQLMDEMYDPGPFGEEDVPMKTEK